MKVRHGGFALLLLVFVQAAVAETEPIIRRTGRAIVQEILRYGRDAGSIATAPVHWNSDRWEKAGLAALALGAVLAADEEIQGLVERNRSDVTEDLANFATPFGGQRAQNISIGLILLGLAIDDPKLRDTGRDALEAYLFAGRILTPLLKRGVGRSRPFLAEGAYAFDPFSGQSSFPSGHATSAFAVATVMASQYRRPLVRYSVYGLASAVAYARVHDNVHFASDVVAGAMVGTVMGRAVVARNRRPGAPPAIFWSPVMLEDGFAVQVTISLEQVRRSFPRE